MKLLPEIRPPLLISLLQYINIYSGPFRTLIPSTSVTVKKVGRGGPAQQMWMTAKDIPAKMVGNVQIWEQMITIANVKMVGKAQLVLKMLKIVLNTGSD